MRQEFCRGISRYLTKKQCPWASVIIKVQGGFLAFESWDDHKIWKAQK